jgi:uncharacterized SAM-binding protein YcdF (DUF218 family)
MVRRLFKIALGLTALVMAYVLFTFGQVWWASRQDDRAAADAAVVLGAAQWNGRPSPVLAARLDHAAELYHAGVVGTVVVAGGKQAGDTVSEGATGYGYLRKKGVPESALKVEVEGRDTYEELSAASHILVDAGVGRSVILVTDPYHVYRSEAIAREVGLDPQGSPTDAASTPAALARETAAVAIGRITGFRRLSNWA